MCLCPEYFEPQTTLDADDENKPWDWPPHIHEDRVLAKVSAIAILSKKQELWPTCLERLQEILQVEAEHEADKKRREEFDLDDVKSAASDPEDFSDAEVSEDSNMAIED